MKPIIDDSVNRNSYPSQLRITDIRFTDVVGAPMHCTLKYKYYMNIPDSIRDRLTEASKIAYELDGEMSKIKDDMANFEDFKTREDSDLWRKWKTSI